VKGNAVTEKAMSAKERLQDLQTALNQRGVQDVKFFFVGTNDIPTSHVAADVEAALQSYISGRVQEMGPLGDSPDA
jgi:lysophospholipase L1-like esterase